MKNETLREVAVGGFMGGLKLGVALLLAVPISLYVVARNFIRDEPFNPLQMLRMPPRGESGPTH